jgi:hypothetical protein
MFVFTPNAWTYMDAFTNASTGGVPGYEFGIKECLRSGIVSSLGFVLPITFMAAAAEGRSFGAAAIASGHPLVSLVLAGLMIITLS